MKQILKWPLIVAAVVVVLRVIAERAGAPEIVSNLLSVAALHTLLGPIYFAIQVGLSGTDPRPYLRLFKLIVLYAVLTRAMILPTYWLARIFDWRDSRFGGLSPSESDALTGFITIPVLTGVFWIVASMVVGTAIGSIVLAVIRSRTKQRIGV